MGGASPKRRMKSMNGMHTPNLDFCHDPFSGGGGTTNYGASNFAGSGGGSVELLAWETEEERAAIAWEGALVALAVGLAVPLSRVPRACPPRTSLQRGWRHRTLTLTVVMVVATPLIKGRVRPPRRLRF